MNKISPEMPELQSMDITADNITKLKSLVGVSWKGIDGGFFWTAMQNAVDWRMDLVNCLIKSLVFAITVTWIALFNGYDAIPTSAGISRATTRTVVHASLAVLGLDFVLTALMFGN